MAVEAGKFRRDLYHRLAVEVIRVPPLRERLEDIPLLIAHFVERACRAKGRTPLQVTSAVLAQARAYAWPGNVRELENVVVSAVGACNGDALESIAIRKKPLATPPSTRSDARPWPVPRLEQLASVLAHRTVAAEANNVAAAARALDISRTTLYRLMSQPCNEDTAVDWTAFMRMTLAEAERIAVVSAWQHLRGDKRAMEETLGLAATTLRTKLRQYHLGGVDSGFDRQD
jgi:DNA-binding NtrC family response regulator